VKSEKVRTIVPAELFPPGDFIKEELEARGWTQEDLADILGRNPRLVNEIISGRRGITPETAKGLGDAFGTGAQFWMNLESAYRLSLVRATSNPVAHRATIYMKAPVRLMIKRQWIEPSESVQVLETRLLEFFQINNLGEEPKFWAVARKSTSYKTVTPAQNAWLFRARHLAPAVSAAAFTETRFKQGLGQLRTILANPEDIRHVPRILAGAGIRILIIEPLPQTRIDGACFWLDNRSPVVVLSLRYDRIDWFWYTLMHELGHVQNKDGLDANTPLDTDLVGEQAQTADTKPEFEKAADRFAAESLIPQDKLDDFIARIHPLYSRKRIVGFASLIGVPPGLVVGQLQHRGKISYAYNRDMLVKIRHIITEAALTDGWGNNLPSSL
jgi:HTH-type transcriptional regulator/antitoxin HigA